MSEMTSEDLANNFPGGMVARLNTLCQAHRMHCTYAFEQSAAGNGMLFRGKVNVGSEDFGYTDYVGQWKNNKKKAKGSAAGAFFNSELARTLLAADDARANADNNFIDEDDDEDLYGCEVLPANIFAAAAASVPRPTVATTGAAAAAAAAPVNVRTLDLRFDIALADVNALRAHNGVPPLRNENTLLRAKRDAWAYFLAKLLTVSD